MNRCGHIEVSVYDIEVSVYDIEVRVYVKRTYHKEDGPRPRCRARHPPWENPSTAISV